MWNNNNNNILVQTWPCFLLKNKLGFVSPNRWNLDELKYTCLKLNQINFNEQLYRKVISYLLVHISNWNFKVKQSSAYPKFDPNLDLSGVFTNMVEFINISWVNSYNATRMFHSLTKKGKITFCEMS